MLPFRTRGLHPRLLFPEKSVGFRPLPWVNRLPHLTLAGKPCFLTWRLAGSIPRVLNASLYTSAGPKFVEFDRLLDAHATGPLWLRRPEIAALVIAALRRGQESGAFELGSWVIMPNHVHVLLYPDMPVARIVGSIKRLTAREANAVLGRDGPFWNKDYFDRSIRDRDHAQRVQRCIEINPVNAGLCATPDQWPYSSVSANWSL
jgi:putative transposase